MNFNNISVGDNCICKIYPILADQGNVLVGIFHRITENGDVIGILHGGNYVFRCLNRRIHIIRNGITGFRIGYIRLIPIPIQHGGKIGVAAFLPLLPPVGIPVSKGGVAKLQGNQLVIGNIQRGIQ